MKSITLARMKRKNRMGVALGGLPPRCGRGRLAPAPFAGEGWGGGRPKVLARYDCLARAFSPPLFPNPPPQRGEGNLASRRVFAQPRGVTLLDGDFRLEEDGAGLDIG